MKIKKMSKKTKYSYIETNKSLIPYDNKTAIFKYGTNDSIAGDALREKINWDKVIFYTEIKQKVDFSENLKIDYKNLFRIKIYCNQFVITLYFKNEVWHEKVFNTLKEKIKKQENINLDVFNHYQNNYLERLF